jgi:hypothetical protein
MLPALIASLTAFPAAAAAQSLDAAGTHISSFADTRPIPSQAQLAIEQASLRLMYCSGGAPAMRQVSLDAALGAARRQVASDSHGGGLAAFSSSSAGRTEPEAIAAAAGAVAGGKPIAALAALLRAHSLKPGDPVPLIDAAPELSDAGLPADALAFLTAAQKLPAPKTDPFGIGWPAVIDANRGQALLVAHQYGAAETALQAAVKAAPLMTEADQNLGVAYDCQGNTPKSTKYLVAAVARQEFAGDDYFGQDGGDPFGQLDPADALDTSQGQQLTLETFQVPNSIAVGHAEYEFFNTYDQQQVTAGTQLNQQFGADDGRLTAKLESESPATRQRTNEIEQAVADAGNEPDIAPLQQAASDASTRIYQIVEQEIGPAGCLDSGASQGQLMDDLAQADAAWRKFADALYERQTAYAANLEDPLAHQVAIDTADSWAQANFQLLLADWTEATTYDSVCDTTAPTADDPITGKRNEPPSKRCPTGLLAPSFAINLVVVSFWVDCESVSADLTLGEGWLNGFINLSKNYRTGQTTIYAGGQAGATIKLGPLSGGPSARGGLYMTVDSNGGIDDIGVRASTSAGVTVGPTAVGVSGPGISISIVEAFVGPATP